VTAGEPGHVYVCHCKACQRRTGAAFHFDTLWQKDQVRIDGDFKTYERDTARGKKIRFHFCPRCGSNVFWDTDRRPTSYGIAAGTFADPSFPSPTFALWEESMHSWVDLQAVDEHYDQGLPTASG
jgi:hypothetical protein